MKGTGIATAVAVVCALIFSFMWAQLFELLAKLILSLNNEYVVLPIIILTKFAPTPFGVVLSALLVVWAFPAANTKTVYHALTALLVILGIVDVIYGGGVVLAFVEVPVVLITIAVTKSLLRSRSEQPASRQAEIG
ncbi:MAG TPA: hypothetical protein VGP48_06505 [Stellaceae bacterium]|nr:hypothetical protein [Stellaceae bacterium]